MSLIIGADKGALKVGDLRRGFSAPTPDRNRAQFYPDQPFRVLRRATEEEFVAQLEEYGVTHLRTKFEGEYWLIHTD